MKAGFILLSVRGQETFSASFKNTELTKSESQEQIRNQLVRTIGKGEIRKLARDSSVIWMPSLSQGELRAILRFESRFGNTRNQLVQVVTEKAMFHQLQAYSSPSWIIHGFGEIRAEESGHMRFEIAKICGPLIQSLLLVLCPKIWPMQCSRVVKSNLLIWMNNSPKTIRDDNFILTYAN